MASYTVQELANAMGRNVRLDAKTIIISRCPFCAEPWAFKFNGSVGAWECWACHPDTGLWEELVELIKGNYELRDKLSDMKKPAPPEGLIVMSEYTTPPAGRRISTGFGSLDRLIRGFKPHALTILTGKQGEGKSTYAGQLVLAAVNDGIPAFLYSGELDAEGVREWLYGQAAGSTWCQEWCDEYGTTRYKVDPYAESRINSWLGNRLILYDNTNVKSSERNAITARMKHAQEFYGCGFFVVDNLMTAKYDTEKEQDYNRAQSCFVGDLTDFAQTTDSHVVLVAHPRKGTMGDINDDVSGSGEITRRSSNVMRVERVKPADRLTEGCDAILTVAKNREYGANGDIKMTFDMVSRRFIPTSGSFIDKYKWEENC